MAKKKDWESKAVKHPGRITDDAKRAGMSVHAYAEKERKAEGSLGDAARLALEFEKMHGK